MPNLVGKDKFIFAMDTLGLLNSFDLNNSKVVWQKKIGTRETTYTANPGGLSLFQNTLYAHLGGLNLVALNASTGEILWKKNFQMPIVSGPTSSKRGVFITLINGTLKFKRFKWRINLGEKSNF